LRATTATCCSSTGSGIPVLGIEPAANIAELAVKTKAQKGIKIEHTIIPTANHFFEGKHDDLKQLVGAYVDRRMVEIEAARKEAE